MLVPLQKTMIPLGSLAVLVLLVVLLRQPGRTRIRGGGGSVSPLIVYCAAGIKAPVEAVAEEYGRCYGVKIQLNYGGSGTLLSLVRVRGTGDVYIPADASYIDAARSGGLLMEVIPLATQYPVILVAGGNPKAIHAVDDLLREDVRVALAQPDAASIGRTVRALLQPSGRWAALARRAVVFKPTVNDVATDVKIGAVDAGIVWDALAVHYPDLVSVRVPLFDAAPETLNVAVLASSQNPRSALRFARYLGAKDKGLVHFKALGYTPVEGDAWAETSGPDFDDAESGRHHKAAPVP